MSITSVESLRFKKVSKQKVQQLANYTRSILTNDAERPADGNDRPRVDLADVLSGVVLLNVVDPQVVGLPRVVRDADALVHRDHHRVDGQGALLRVQPGHLVVRAEVLHRARELDGLADANREVAQLGVGEAGRRVEQV